MATKTLFAKNEQRWIYIFWLKQHFLFGQHHFHFHSLNACVYVYVCMCVCVCVRASTYMIWNASPPAAAAWVEFNQWIFWSINFQLSISLQKRQHSQEEERKQSIIGLQKMNVHAKNIAHYKPGVSTILSHNVYKI